MPPTTRTIFPALALSLAALLAACGGGGGDASPPAGRATGAWVGSTSTQRELTAIVLADGSYYGVYSGANDPATVGGAIQGTGSFAGGRFDSQDLVDFNVEGAGSSAGSFEATVPLGVILSGTLARTSGAGFEFRAGSDGDFDEAPSLQALAGAYKGQAGFALGIRPATFSVSASGQVTSGINGCAITGSAMPRGDGKAYDLVITFGGSPCAIPNASFSGIAYLRADGRLVAVARNPGLRQSVIFSGSR